MSANTGNWRTIRTTKFPLIVYNTTFVAQFDINQPY
jgi:hypothetical protein